MSDFRELLNDNQHISEIFLQLDTKKKGYLTKEELKLAVVELFGYKPSKYEIHQLIASSSHESNAISKEQFLKAMKSKQSNQDENDEIRQLFVACDLKCRGFICFEDVERIFQQSASYMKNFDVKRLFEEVDRDKDGRITFRDFEYMLKFSTK